MAIDPKLFEVAVKGIILDNEGKLFLQQEKGKDLWGLPGGRLEHGEHFHQTLMREIKEEMGVDSKVIDDHPYWSTIEHIRDDIWRVFLCFRVQLTSDTFIVTDEHNTHQYFSKEEIEQLDDKLFSQWVKEIL